MKKIALFAGLTALLVMGAVADEMKVAPKISDTPPVAPDPKGGDDFSGTITAVLSTGASFTVVDVDGKVKIFSVPEDQQGKLTVGQKVTVKYTEQYTWPLHARSVTVLGQ